MTDAILAKLLIYGPLGVICVILLIAVVTLYRTLSAERAAKDAKLDQLNEHYVEKAEFWMDKYHQLLQQTNSIVDKFIQRMK